MRAVTFESPGSVEILEELGQSNVERFNLTAKDLGNKLDVKTYLLAPNFINTCNKHIGKVYRLYETSTPERRIKIIDDFTVNSFINAFPVKEVREKLTEWYKNKVKHNFSQYIFYLNGLRSIFSDDISWILNEFDSDKRIFKCEVREVMNWPHMKFKPKREHFDNLDFKILDKLSNFISFGQIVPNKTTLARMYAYYRKKSDPKILVISIDSESLTANLLDIIDKLNGEVNQDLKTEKELIKLANERLKSINKQVIFIFDNVKHLDEIKEIYSNLKNHKFLITTKKENLFENYDREKKFGVKITPFNENDCLEYLKLKGIDVKSKKEKESWIEII